MSIWISRLAALAVAMLTLPGCSGLSAGGPAPAARMALADGAVVVAGPPGYCVAPETRHENGARDFVMLGACAAMGGGTDSPPAVPAVLTAAVIDGPADGTPDTRPPDRAKALRRFFASDRGRAALSRAGDADTVQVLESSVRDGVFVLHVHDSAEGAAPGLGAESWRAMFTLGDRMVAASVLQPAGSPLPAPVALSLLDRFVARIRAESRAPAAVAAAPR